MNFIDKNTIRTLFSRAMSDMYRIEVPQYQILLDIVDVVNKRTLSANPDLYSLLKEINELDRISEERHGAIRLGKPEELYTMRRLFEVMGMYPVGYYDLSVAGIPVHSTAFRPIKNVDLKKNPFRIFTSLLRIDLIEDLKIQKMAEEILKSRDIFTNRVRELICLNEKQGGLFFEEAEEFVREALETFRWHDKAIVSFEKYKALEKIHPLIADIVSFRGPHINHLTPRTLDINEIQIMMPKYKLNPKAIIEGPPKRKVAILLRQTSFKALEESILFTTDNNKYIPGMHKARFGEIEQRGAALTPKGKKLYEQLLEKVRAKVTPNIDGSNVDEYNVILEQEFQSFPDNIDEMRRQGLVHLVYRATEKGIINSRKLTTDNLESLIMDGYIEFSPVVYEDFLPVSAAGIFTSNLGEDQTHIIQATSSQQAFEEALGTKVFDAFELYNAKESSSLKATFKNLGISTEML